ncbi:MAG: LOG family protein [Alphaproteobacteria bacterium]
MSEGFHRPPKAYKNEAFLNSRDARPIRILAEYLEPVERFEDQRIEDTIVFQGSARIPSREEAEAGLDAARREGGDVARAEMWLRMSRYYEDARELARRLTEWSKGLKTSDGRRFVVCTGGGPGIMEAANRGAAEAKGLNVGLAISLPGVGEPANSYVTHQLAFEFHYFFMRKFWFTYLAKAIVVLPGGFGTLDELFEVLTLIQTLKIKKRMPIVLFGGEFWRDVVDFDALVRYGTISAEDLDLFFTTDSVDDAYDFITRELTEHALGVPGATL